MAVASDSEEIAKLGTVVFERLECEQHSTLGISVTLWERGKLVPSCKMSVCDIA